MKMDKIAKVII